MSSPLLGTSRGKNQSCGHDTECNANPSKIESDKPWRYTGVCSFLPHRHASHEIDFDIDCHRRSGLSCAATVRWPSGYPRSRSSLVCAVSGVHRRYGRTISTIRRRISERYPLSSIVGVNPGLLPGLRGPRDRSTTARRRIGGIQCIGVIDVGGDR